MRKSLFVVAIMASALLAPAADAANDLASEQLLKSTGDQSKLKVQKQAFRSGPEVTKDCLLHHT